ncbi:MAG: anthranilate phosphoribosyltransferase [Pseudomonadota bacterium]|jgi:anthranilate phosphoribosyltransferase
MSTVSVREIVAGRPLSVEESRLLMHDIVLGVVQPAQVAAVLTALAIRGFDVDILDGFTVAARELALPLELAASDLIDVCGTGGDGKSTFNISTAVAFVLAGAGYRVAKHGNVAVSSACGSSNVLQALGVELSGNPDHLKRSLDRHGVCFIHAPLFHPAFKHVASIRQQLGFRTIFNALGPLINPAVVAYRYSGVYSLELQRIYSYLLTRRGERFAVVHALDGYDEISLTGSARVLAECGVWELAAGDFGVATVQPNQIAAPSTLAESAKLIESVLSAESTGTEREYAQQRDVVIANAATALWCFEGANRDLSHYVAVARESLESGKARRVLEGCRSV